MPEDINTASSQRNDLSPEEFPDGAYGMSAEPDVIEGKSSPWRRGQHSPHPYGYENKRLHDGLSRQYPGDQGEGSTD